MNQNKKSSLSESNVNRFGFAQLQNLKNKITGNADSKLNSVQVRAKQIFADKFVEKASAGLENAIRTGALSATAQPAQGQAQPAQQPGQPAQAGQPQQPGQPATPGQQSPEQIRKAKQAAAVNAINKPAPAAKPAPTGTAMPTKPYQVPGLGTNPNQAQTKVAPAQPQQKQFKATSGPNPEDYANLEKRIKAQTQQVQRESKYEKLNAIFESILNEQTPTISSYVMDAFKAFAHGPGLNDPALMKQAQALADEVQATYNKDKGLAALRKLGDLGYTVATAPGQEEPAGQGQSGAPAQPAGTAQPASGGQQPSGATAKQVYQQISKLLDPLDSASQQKVVNGLEKYVQMN